MYANCSTVVIVLTCQRHHNALCLSLNIGIGNVVKKEEAWKEVAEEIGSTGKHLVNAILQA